MPDLDVRSLPRFDSWASGFAQPPTGWDYACQQGGLTLAIAVSTLLYPTFHDVEGCLIVRERYFPEAFREWRDRLDDLAEVERVTNHIHLWDMFDPDGEGVPDDVLRAFGQNTARSWELALHDQHPRRGGRATFSWDEGEYGPTITAFSAH
jgi:hypothetical protein